MKPKYYDVVFDWRPHISQRSRRPLELLLEGRVHDLELGRDGLRGQSDKWPSFAELQEIRSAVTDLSGLERLAGAIVPRGTGCTCDDCDELRVLGAVNTDACVTVRNFAGSALPLIWRDSDDPESTPVTRQATRLLQSMPSGIRLGRVTVTHYNEGGGPAFRVRIVELVSMEGFREPTPEERQWLTAHSFEYHSGVGFQRREDCEPDDLWRTLPNHPCEDRRGCVVSPQITPLGAAGK